MTMIEQVAEAVNDRLSDLTKMRKWAELSPKEREECCFVVRAVVEELREPDMPMQNAGWREIDKQGFQTEDTEVAPIWRAMIDSILSQPQEEKVK